MEVRTDQYVFFWERDSVFSNWHEPAPMTYMGNNFKNSEALMMWFKAMLFDDLVVANRILTEANPKTGVVQCPKHVRDLGRLVSNFDQAKWDAAKEEIMFEVCLTKFSQNASFRDYLLATEDLILVEASPFDRIWGIGLRPDDPKALDPKNWRGQNLLGIALMRVREALRKVAAIMQS